MSNSPTNREQDALFVQTPSQLNPGSARASDFAIEDRDGGQCGDSKAERAALLKEASDDGKSELGETIPERNEVPRYTA